MPTHESFIRLGFMYWCWVEVKEQEMNRGRGKGTELGEDGR